MPVTRSQSQRGKNAATPRNYKELATKANILDTPNNDLPVRATRKQRAALVRDSLKSSQKGGIKPAHLDDDAARSGTKDSQTALQVSVVRTSAQKELRCVVRKSYVMPVISGARGFSRVTTRIISEVALGVVYPKNVPNGCAFQNGIVSGLKTYALNQFSKMTTNANRLEAKFQRLLQDLTTSVQIASRDSSIAVLPKTPCRHDLMKRALVKTPGENVGAASPASKFQRCNTFHDAVPGRTDQTLFKTPTAVGESTASGMKKTPRSELDERFSTAIQWNTGNDNYVANVVSSPHAPNLSSSSAKESHADRAYSSYETLPAALSSKTASLPMVDAADAVLVVGKRDSVASSLADTTDFARVSRTPRPGIQRSGMRLSRAPGFKKQRFSVLSTYAASSSAVKVDDITSDVDPFQVADSVGNISANMHSLFKAVELILDDAADGNQWHDTPATTARSENLQDAMPGLYKPLAGRAEVSAARSLSIGFPSLAQDIVRTKHQQIASTPENAGTPNRIRPPAQQQRILLSKVTTKTLCNGIINQTAGETKCNTRNEWLDVQQTIDATASPFLQSPTRPPQPLRQPVVAKVADSMTVISSLADLASGEDVVDRKESAAVADADVCEEIPPSVPKRAVIVKPIATRAEAQFQRSDDAVGAPGIRGGQKKNCASHTVNRGQLVGAKKQQECGGDAASRKRQAVLQARAEILRGKREAYARQAQENREMQMFTDSKANFSNGSGQHRPHFPPSFSWQQQHYASNNMLSSALRSSSAASNHSNNSSICSAMTKKQQLGCFARNPAIFSTVEQSLGTKSKFPPLKAVPRQRMADCNVSKTTTLPTSASCQELRSQHASRLPPPPPIANWTTAPAKTSHKINTTSSGSVFPGKNVTTKFQQIDDDRRRHVAAGTAVTVIKSVVEHSRPTAASEKLQNHDFSTASNTLAPIVPLITTPPALSAAITTNVVNTLKQSFCVHQTTDSRLSTFSESGGSVSAQLEICNANQLVSATRFAQNYTDKVDYKTPQSLNVADALPRISWSQQRQNSQLPSSQQYFGSLASSKNVKLPRDSCVTMECFAEPDVSSISNITEPSSLQPDDESSDIGSAVMTTDSATETTMLMEDVGTLSGIPVPFSAHKDSLMIKHVPRHELSPISGVTSSSLTSASTISSTFLPEKIHDVSATAVDIASNLSQQLSPRTNLDRLSITERADDFDTPQAGCTYANLTGTSAQHQNNAAYNATKQPSSKIKSVLSEQRLPQYQSNQTFNTGGDEPLLAALCSVNGTLLDKTFETFAPILRPSANVFGSVASFGTPGNIYSGRDGMDAVPFTTGGSSFADVPTFGGVPIIPPLSSSQFNPSLAAVIQPPLPVVIQSGFTQQPAASSAVVFHAENSNISSAHTIVSSALPTSAGNSLASLTRAPAEISSYAGQTTSVGNVGLLPTSVHQLRVQSSYQQQKQYQPYTTGMLAAGLNTTFDIEDKDEDDATYGIDINSDDSTDDEAKPKKKLPRWAQTEELRALLRKQYQTNWNLDEMFVGGIQFPVDLVAIFQLNSFKGKKINTRSSSGYWEHPIPPLGVLRPHTAISNSSVLANEQSAMRLV